MQDHRHATPAAARRLANDAAADRFLILDVARYKYRPAWATASELFNAMNTTDPDAGNKTRGFALVSKTGS